MRAYKIKFSKVSFKPSHELKLYISDFHEFYFTLFFYFHEF